MQRFFHWIVVAVLVLVGLWGLIVYGELFRAHMQLFLFLWLFLPVVALWLKTKRVRSAFTISGLKATRNLLVAVTVSISFVSFTHYDRIRDAIGHRFVSGYYVSYYEDTDDYGRPYRASEPHTAHWYSRFGLWMFEWLFLGACVGLPFIIWRSVNSAVDEAVKERNAEAA
jgi:hypothetical protein